MAMTFGKPHPKQGRRLQEGDQDCRKRVGTIVQPGRTAGWLLPRMSGALTPASRDSGQKASIF